MRYAPGVRKKILTVLEDHVLPVLQTQTVSQLLAKPPFYSNGVVSSIVQKTLLPNKETNPLNVTLDWEKEQLRARRMAILGFSYSGISLERVGITRKMAKSLGQDNVPAPAGITSFRLESPGILCVPPHIPHDGRCLAEEGNGQSILLLWFTDKELWVGHSDAIEGGVHNFCIADAKFPRMQQAYVEALEKRDFQLGQMIVLNLMTHLFDYLKDHQVNLSNSAWPEFADKSIVLAPDVSARNADYCYRVFEYIQFHLHAPLSVEGLAKICGITGPHLSTIFRQSTGITLMNYVTDQRLSAAELMLRLTDERVSDIAVLSGFSSPHSFAGAFRRRFGMSATLYRQQNARRPIN